MGWNAENRYGSHEGCGHGEQWPVAQPRITKVICG